MNAYAELQVTTNYSFLRGGSHASELVYTAAELGLSAIAVTDHNSLAGVVKAHAAAREFGIKVVIGCRLNFDMERRSILCFPQDKAAYARLVRLLTLGKGRGGKGLCSLWYDDLKNFGEGQIVVELADEANDVLRENLTDLRRDFAGRCYVALTRRYQPDEELRLHNLNELAFIVGIPTVVTNDVQYHIDSRRILHDVVTCVREGVTIDELGHKREVSSDRYIKPPAEMYRLFRGYDDAVARSVEIANRCKFSLDELQYQYPDEHFFPGKTAQEALVDLTAQGAGQRYPNGVPEKVAKQIEHEMQLIAQLKYAPYFLTVWRIVDFARSQGIKCQGRGSAANSAVCFCLGITSIDPAFTDLLFERFISADRNEPPDIDVDFEHERREEVIQWIYQTYGRERAALAATVVHYRSKRAVREVGKALGLSEDVIESLAKSVWGWGNEGIPQEQVRAIGLDPNEYRLAMTLRVTEQLIGFPRHLSQHPGGFVIARDRLDELVPIEPASMEDRSVVEWDKDDLDELSMLKVDILALGMLSCIRKSFEYLSDLKGLQLDIATVPAEDPAVYDMICEADTIGVFQIESRAQMSMLPRLRPRTFYDLVIECAIVRPGPIQGDMVHPYLRRRQGKEKVTFPSKELESVLGKTLGVPLFQEQAMKIAIVAAGFTPSEADQLRRSMASFRSRGTIATFRQRFISGMVTRGYQHDFAERCFSQIEGFGTYGFPESHSASFAILIYVSCWIKHHHPEIFLCAILNSQPMGFYAPAQLVRDAKNHNVQVLPIDVNISRWDCTLEATTQGYAVRIGFRYVKGFNEESSARVVSARYEPYQSIEDLVRRSGTREAQLELLADGDAFASFGLDRHKASWTIKGLRSDQLPLFAAADKREANHTPELLEPTVDLPALSEGGECLQDYQTISFSLRNHPLHFIRQQLTSERWSSLQVVGNGRDGHRVRIAGLVLVRQRPGSAKGVTFITLEDETANANLVMWPNLFEKFRSIVLTAGLIGCVGRIQREGSVIHVVVEQLENLSSFLRQIGQSEQALISPFARADEGSKGSSGRDSRDPKEERQPAPPRTLWKHPREVNVIGELDDPRKEPKLANVRHFH
jgi:error-prone DNA polymerase